MKISSFIFAVVAAISSVDAFVAPKVPVQKVSSSITVVAAATDEEIDFDAPSDRIAAVGNAVRAPKGGGFQVPDFLAKIFNLKNEKAVAEFDDMILNTMDDECYMGKDGNAPECVDFDPPVIP